MRVALLLCLALYELHSSVAHNRETSRRNMGCYLLLETCNYLPTCNCHHNSKGDTVEPLEALDTRHLILHSLSYKVCKTHSCTEVPGRESFYDCGNWALRLLDPNARRSWLVCFSGVTRQVLLVWLNSGITTGHIQTAADTGRHGTESRDIQLVKRFPETESASQEIPRILC